MGDDASRDSQPNVQRVVTSRDQARSYYNKIARMYDLLAARSEGAMCEAGLELLAVTKHERVLEVGCGTGSSLVHLHHGVDGTGFVAGIDLSERMLERARALLQKRRITNGPELCQGDACHLPFAPEGFDAVFASFTLELFDTPEIPAVLAEFWRVLRPGGRAGIVSISREGKPGLVSDLYEWMHRRFPKLLDCRPIYVQKALESAGFTIQQTKLESMWLPVEIVVATKPG